MVSTLASLAVLALPLSTVPVANPVTGKPWEDRLLPRCEDMVPAQVQRNWNLASVKADRDQDVDTQTMCRFTTNGRALAVFYQCGASKMDTPPLPKSKGAFGAIGVPGIGRRAAATVDDELSLAALDDDTPCEIRIFWPDPNGMDTAKRLMQDLLAAATPALVGKSRLEANYLDPESPAGRALFSSLDAWKKEAAGIEGFINLAPGYPRLVEGKTLPGLPEGKVALLGLCPIGSALKGNALSMPGILRALVDAPASAEACPTAAYPGMLWWQLDEDPEMKLGDRTLGMDFRYWEGRTSTAWVRAYLRDKEGALVSVATEQVKMLDSVDRQCTPKLRKTKSGATFKVTCIVETPDKCKKNPTWWLTQTFKVSGDKITIKSNQKAENGVDCMPTAE